MTQSNQMAPFQPRTQFPVEVYEIAAQHQLGQPIKRLRLGLSGCSNLFVSGVMFFVTIICFASVTFAVVPGVVDNPPPSGIAIFLATMGIVTIPIGIVLFRFFLQTRHLVYECEKGFLILSKRSGEKAEMAVRWDEIQDVRIERGHYNTFYYLEGENGRSRRVQARRLWLRCREVVRARAQK
jgi:hypothetical protein